jgi:hypothetical protein
VILMVIGLFLASPAAAAFLPARRAASVDPWTLCDQITDTNGAQPETSEADFSTGCLAADARPITHAGIERGGNAPMRNACSRN